MAVVVIDENAQDLLKMRLVEHLDWAPGLGTVDALGSL
jgi:hypothetical protein